MTNAVPRRILWALYVCSFGSMASMRVCDSMLPALATTFAVSAESTSQVISSFALAYGVMQLAMGPTGDRFGKVRVIACTTLACAIGNLGAALATSMDHIVAARVFSGAAAAGIIPLTMAWLGDRVPYEERHVILAKLLGATVFGLVVGQWAGGLLSTTFGWRTAFAALTVVFLFGGVASLFGTRQLGTVPSTETVSMTKQALAVLTLPWARTVLFITFLEGCFAFSALAFIPTHLNTSLHVAMAEAGLVAGLYGIGGLAYSSFARPLLRHFSERGFARLGGVLLCMAYCTIAVASNWLLALPACLAAGFGFYCLHNVLQMNATQMAPMVRGTAVSMFACVLFLGQSLGVTVAAWLIASWSTTFLFLSCGVGLLIVAFAAAWLIDRSRPPNPAVAETS